MATSKRKIRPLTVDNKKAEREKKTHRSRRRSDVSGDAAAADKAKAAGQAKADELRTALESKVEQGKCSLGSLLAEESEGD